MMVNVGVDLFLSHSTNRATQIATHPQRLSPVAFLERRKLVLQFARRYALDELSDLGWTQTRRCRDHQMDVVTAGMPFDDRDFSTGADLADDLTRTLGGLAAQDLVAVFCDPDNVIVNVVDRMRSLTRVGHCLCSPILQGILLSFRADP